MSTTVYCDLCQQVIKPNSKKYIFAVTDITQDEGGIKIRSVYELEEELQRQRGKVEVHEMCVNCYKVLRHVLKMRKDKLEQIQKEINNIFNTKYRKHKERDKS